MPNPTIAPAAWADGAIYTVSDSGFAAIDVNMSEIDEETAQIILTVPAGGVVAVLRNPANWAGASTSLLSGGVWTGVPVALGDWEVAISPGAAATDPATLNISSGSSGASGLLRILITGLADHPVTIEPGGGTISIDRVLADPRVLNVHVANPPLPVREKAAVTLSASVLPTAVENGAPMAPLPALPALVLSWSTDPSNPIGLPDFTDLGATATFTAPAVTATESVAFTVTGATDLAGNGTIDAADPQTSAALSVDIEPVRYGMVLVLDRSGSMASGLGGTGLSKWQAAVQAAHAWTDLFRALRPGDEHLAGIVTFEHDACSWTPTPGADVTFREPDDGAAVSGMTPLHDFAIETNTWQLGEEQTCTPIGDALVKAWKGIGNALGPSDIGAVILMTDGYENAGRVTIAATAGSASTTFEAARVAPDLQVANTLIGDNLYTLAIGGSVDEDRLNDLGSAYYQQIKTSVSEVKPAFAAMLGHMLDAEELMPSPMPKAIRYLVPAGERLVAFLVTWTAINHRIRLSWRPQGGDAFTTVNHADPGVSEIRRGTHGLTSVDLHELPGIGDHATEWMVEHLDAASNPLALPMTDALAMVDLRTKVDVGFDRRQYFLGEPITLHCRIRSGGVPVTNATVGIDFARPGEGLGTFLTVNAGRLKPGQIDQPGSLTHGPSASATQPGGSGDPLSGKGLMFQTLLQVTGMDDLPIVTPPQFQLHDPHGRGDFTNAMSDTVKEGTYTFRFRVEGELADGSRFSRLFVRSTWVGVRPDPEQIDATWTVVGPTVSTVTFRPRYGQEFLGPYRSAVIDTRVSAGVADGPLIDNLNGSYTLRVRHARDVDPIVSIDIYGTPMVPTGPAIFPPGTAGRHCCALWHRAFRCTLAGLRRLLFGK